MDNKLAVLLANIQAIDRDNFTEMLDLTYKINGCILFSDENELTHLLEVLNLFVSVELDLTTRTGKRKNDLENHFLGIIKSSLYQCSYKLDYCEKLLDNDLRREGFEAIDATMYKTLVMANDLFLRTQGNDNNTTVRNCLCLEIYGQLMSLYEIPNKFVHFRSALKSKKQKLSSMAAQVLSVNNTNTDYADLPKDRC